VLPLSVLPILHHLPRKKIVILSGAEGPVFRFTPEIRRYALTLPGSVSYGIDSFVTTVALLYPAFRSPLLEAPLTQSLSPIDSLLFQIVLATLAIGLPILVVLSIRFLWDRNVRLGRSKELEKLIWQLHRIASAMEHQMNLSFPAVQPGTEDPRDRAYLQQSPAQPTAAAASPATSRAATAAPDQPTDQRAATPPATQQTPPPLQQRDPSADAPRAGVNSMFGL
jgi:hypothetical protein